jgi:hypothetical protein
MFDASFARLLASLSGLVGMLGLPAKRRKLAKDKMPIENNFFVDGRGDMFDAQMDGDFGMGTFSVLPIILHLIFPQGMDQDEPWVEARPLTRLGSTEVTAFKPSLPLCSGSSSCSN